MSFWVQPCVAMRFTDINSRGTGFLRTTGVGIHDRLRENFVEQRLPHSVSNA